MRKIALLFPGQGSQFIGMGKTLCKRYSIARDTFAEANDLLGFDLQKMCFEGSLEELTKSQNAQPAILTTSVAAYRVYKQKYDLTPTYVVGHSLGEVSALTCAGGIRFSDAIHMVRQRGTLMQEVFDARLGGMMLVLGMNHYRLEYECRKIAEESEPIGISCYNSPVQTIVSGGKKAIFQLMKRVTILGGKCAPFSMIAMKVDAPFHSPWMGGVAEKLQKELEKYTYHSLHYPVLSNVTGLPYTSKDEIIAKLVAQQTHPVQWERSIQFLNAEGIEIAIEMGSEKVLKNLMSEITNQIKTYSFDDENDVEMLETELEQELHGLPNLITRSLAVAVSTKNYNLAAEDYQTNVIEPFKQLKALEMRRKANQQLTVEEMEQALTLLSAIFAGKKVPVDLQIKKFANILKSTRTEDLFAAFVEGKVG